MCKRFSFSQTDSSNSNKANKSINQCFYTMESIITDLCLSNNPKQIKRHHGSHKT